MRERENIPFERLISMPQRNNINARHTSQYRIALGQWPDPLTISLNDLITSGQGETVVSILTDLNGFWTYENRENLVSSSSSSPTTGRITNTSFKFLFLRTFFSSEAVGWVKLKPTTFEL